MKLKGSDQEKIRNLQSGCLNGHFWLFVAVSNFKFILPLRTHYGLWSQTPAQVQYTVPYIFMRSKLKNLTRTIKCSDCETKSAPLLASNWPKYRVGNPVAGRKLLKKQFCVASECWCMRVALSFGQHLLLLAEIWRWARERTVSDFTYLTGKWSQFLYFWLVICMSTFSLWFTRGLGSLRCPFVQFCHPGLSPDFYFCVIMCSKYPSRSTENGPHHFLRACN